ncbi:MAG: hypothetical protein A3K09_02165 [Nitrospinae bacterium RIFCSPLOWO2_12_FULL_47_7]|nr:MAG: hypothetical protein A3K09_02165 [Nitrospinae bacterium RIFCSPLOWO2_12_FULL_47_7]
MSILARNLKVIRKELRCTQSVVADIVKVGFRTYVRYEAGERDAPASVLVKLAKLGNMSLEQLLTAEISPADVIPAQAVDRQTAPPAVKKCDFRTGQIEFKKTSVRGLLALGDKERKLLGIFRRMSLATQKEFLESVKMASKGSRPIGKVGTEKTVKTGKLKKNAVSAVKVSVPQIRKKGKRGRRVLDKKALKEKIDKLKMLTKSINKITVR